MEKGKAKNSIQIPITRDGMVTLCNSMNLKIKPTKAIDAVIYCRGPKMEQSPEEDFNIEKLVHWFQMNTSTAGLRIISQVQSETNIPHKLK